MKKKTVYTVNVGNIGNIEYTNKKEAIECFKEYVMQSETNTGRAGGESVYLLENEEIIKEYIGENEFTEG